jgi:hypothetical protein
MTHDCLNNGIIIGTTIGLIIAAIAMYVCKAIEENKTKPKLERYGEEINE